MFEIGSNFLPIPTLYLGKGKYFYPNVLEISTTIEWIHTIQISEITGIIDPDVTTTVCEFTKLFTEKMHDLCEFM